MNGHAWFICMGSAEQLETRRERKIKMKIDVSSRTPTYARRPSTGNPALYTTRQRGLDDGLWFNVFVEMGCKLIKPSRDNTCQIDYG